MAENPKNTVPSPGPRDRGRDARRPRRPEPEDRAPARAGTVALLGRPNVGKSTLLNALLGERIAITSHQPQTTRDRIAGIVTRDQVQFVFLDTPGIHKSQSKLGDRMNELANAAASDCDVAIFMTDAEAHEGRPVRVREEDKAILAQIPAGKPTVLVLNKIDRVTPRALLFPVLEAHGSLRDFAAIVPVSALKNDGVDRILAEVEKHLPEGEHLYDPEELSDKPVRFFISEFVREQILKRTRQEVPHGVAVTVESFEEGARLVRIAVTIHVAKDSHKAILIGDRGKMLTEIGSAARRRAEQMLGRQVHLQTWIRATPRWFDDVAQLEDLGYAEGAPERAKKKKKAPPAKSTSPKQPRRNDSASAQRASAKTARGDKARAPGTKKELPPRPSQATKGAAKPSSPTGKKGIREASAPNPSRSGAR